MGYVVLMLFTGCMLALQAPINALLSRRVGMLEGALVNFFVGTAALVIIVAFFGKGQILKVAEAPPWQWIGGLFGALMVCSSIIAVPRIGALSTVLAMIIGNLAMGAVIDNFGWFGLPVTSFTWQRALGFVLLLGGMFFIFRH